MYTLLVVQKMKPQPFFKVVTNNYTDFLVFMAIYD